MHMHPGIYLFLNIHSEYQLVIPCKMNIFSGNVLVLELSDVVYVKIAR